MEDDTRPDWILRVTGKDGGDQNGGGGQQAIQALAKEIRNLLKDVKGSDTNFGEDIQKVQNALGTGGTNGLIGKLAEVLQRFIGYKDGSSNTNGLITGAGIAPSNMATHRLCDAAIAFTIGVLDSLKITKGVRGLTSDFKGKINKVVSSLHAKYGSGTNGLKDVANSIKNEIGNDKLSGSNVNSFVKEMAAAFETDLQNISSDSVDTVASKVGQYLKGVLKSWVTDNATGVNAALHNLGNALQSHKYPYKPNGSDVKYAIGNVNSAIKTELRSFGNTNISYLKPILDAGKNAFLDALTMPNYMCMNYKDASSIQWNGDSDAAKVQACAKIFLGCLPLYYQALTYIYWGCHEKGGGWRNLTLGSGALRSYFDSQGLLPLYVDKSKRGAHIADSALGGFSEFSQGMSGATSSSTFTYASFTTKLREKVNGSTSGCTECPLAALFYGASGYFRYQQIATVKSAGGTPKTIREMLYFLAALQFSPQYDEFDGYVTSHFNVLVGKQSSDDSELKLQVPDSGTSDTGNTLSAADIKEYLRASCALSSSVLGVIQGPGASEKSEPWLFELFCNSAFQFKYPSGDSLFSTISHSAYALQFQLLFLYSMCANNVTKCGWQHCTYGSEINKNVSGSPIPSHICQGLKCGRKSNCTHNGHGSSADCKHTFHPTKNRDPTCGIESASPLQAFLTDCINGLCCTHPSSPSGHLSTCSGAMCHVRMGFQATHLRQNAANGARVYLVLKSICGNVSSPLRQLSEKLGCLTKRTPRSLGDIFGFTWHLNGQLFKQGNQGNIDGAKWFGELKHKLPFSYQLTDNSGGNLKNFVGTGHSRDSHPDLASLTNSKCNQQQQTCGPYLSPLTLSHGATFGKPPSYTSTYLSWMVYLTDDLQSGFQELLDEFKYIDCSKTGCRKSATGGQKCDKAHSPGTHGSNDCSCDSVVHCGGVLPLLYRYGFMFSDMGALFGESNPQTKRTCANFQSQLQSVLSGNPLTKLLESIDDFLFLFRKYFLSHLSGFWTIYIGLILYTFFFLLDTLHLRSHLKLTSHVPPIGLLTSGKPLPITTLTYIRE